MKYKQLVKHIVGDEFEVNEYFAMTPAKLFDYINSGDDSLLEVNSLLITYKGNNTKNNFTLLITFEGKKVVGNYVITRGGKRLTNYIEFPTENLEKVLKALILLFKGKFTENHLLQVARIKR